MRTNKFNELKSIYDKMAAEGTFSWSKFQKVSQASKPTICEFMKLIKSKPSESKPSETVPYLEMDKASRYKLWVSEINKGDARYENIKSLLYKYTSDYYMSSGDVLTLVDKYYRAFNDGFFTVDDFLHFMLTQRRAYIPNKLLKELKKIYLSK